MQVIAINRFDNTIYILVLSNQLIVINDIYIRHTYTHTYIKDFNKKSKKPYNIYLHNTY